MRHTARYLTVALLGLLVALVLAACGGSSPSSTTTVASAPVQIAHPKTPVPRFVGVNRDQISASRKAPITARPPQAGVADDELNSTGRKAVNPCALVSRSAVQAAIRQAVGRPVVAPQGPTCIYKPERAKSQITIAVQSVPFSQTKPQEQLRQRISLKVAGRVAYCGNAGGQMLIVPLAEGRFLSVSAPCPVAASLAAQALTHLTA